MRIGLLFFISFLATSVFAQKFMTVENGFHIEDPKQDAVVSTLPVSVITRKEANTLFNEFVQGGEVPFKNVVGGCMGRAHKMARIAEVKGIIMIKVFVEGRLQTKAKDVHYNKPIQWGRHVAPALFVSNEQNNQPILLVFDPAIFDRPATLDEWQNAMLDKADGFESKITATYFGSRFQYTTRMYDFNRTSWLASDLNAMEISLEGSR